MTPDPVSLRGTRLASLCRALRWPKCTQAFPARPVPLVAFGLLFASLPATAVVIRGRVTDPLGKGIGGARVQLVEAGRVISLAYANPDGSYELRSGDSGRFTLLGSAGGYLPGIGQDFYGGTTDVVLQDVVLSTNTVQQQVSVAATALPTPLPQLTAPVTVLPGPSFATRLGVVDEVRQSPGVFVAQTGQMGSVSTLFVRGGNSTANLVLVDGMPAEDVGGTFDFGNVSATGIGSMEIYRGPDSAIYGTDAGASVVAITTPRGMTLKPVLNYTGDAGNLHTYQNAVTAGGTLRKLDYFAAFDRQDTSNALPGDEYHNATSVANLGYNLTGGTDLRFTIRNKVAAVGLPGAYQFLGLTTEGKQGDQDLYANGLLEHTGEGNWHNLVRYGIARKREQATYSGAVGHPITFQSSFGPFTEFFGNFVTIRGANGYDATGQAAILTGNSDEASNRDQLYYQSDWSPSRHFNGLFGFRYDNERGVFNESAYGVRETTQRTNFEYNLQFQGQFCSRLFYSLGGAVEKNHLYGVAGTPRLGLSFVPIRPGLGWFHGTRLRFNAATGVQEPTLALDYYSLYRQLLQAGDAEDIIRYRLTQPDAERSRTYDFGIDQSLYGDKLILKAGYFHNVFDRQLEGVTGANLAGYFGLNSPEFNNPNTSPFYFNALYVNSLAFRAQGAEAELDWQARRSLLVRGGYTYLASRVLQSFASDAVDANQGSATENPAFPGIAIGAESPLVGARPFRRPPHSGFFSATYTKTRYSLAVKGAYASRSDDSTFLDGFTPSFDNSLLLPNRDLDHGYVQLDLGGVYQLQRKVSIFAQLDNLLNDQHIAPIGYPSLPLTVRAGLKIRLGGD